jgi:hypothetical protein
VIIINLYNEYYGKNLIEAEGGILIFYYMVMLISGVGTASFLKKFGKIINKYINIMIITLILTSVSYLYSKLAILECK